MTKKKNPVRNIKAIKRSHIRRYGKPLKGKSRVVTITPDMIVELPSFETEATHWMNVWANDEKQVGGTI